jgi:hypothetical protein
LTRAIRRRWRAGSFNQIKHRRQLARAREGAKTLAARRRPEFNEESRNIHISVDNLVHKSLSRERISSPFIKLSVTA